MRDALSHSSDGGPVDLKDHAISLGIPVEDVVAGVQMLSAATLSRVYAFTDWEVDRICEARGWRDRADEPPPPIIRELELRRELRHHKPVPTVREAIANLADGNNEGARALARDQLMPSWMRPPLAKKGPRTKPYRATVVRRKGPQLPPSIWWSRGGYHAWDVKTWVEKGVESACPVERFMVCALHREMDGERARLDGEQQQRRRKLCATPWQRVFPLASLAMVLYYESRSTSRTGFAACAAGLPRGQLARLSAHKSRGSDLVPDTVSILLRRLRTVLSGVLEYHQPNPDEAKRLGLPHAVHYLEDGRQVFQACNVYWLRDARWCVENARKLGFDFSSIRVDQSQGYGGLPIYQRLTPLAEVTETGGKVSSLPAPTYPGGPRPASLPPAMARGQPP